MAGKGERQIPSQHEKERLETAELMKDAQEQARREVARLRQAAEVTTSRIIVRKAPRTYFRAGMGKYPLGRSITSAGMTWRAASFNTPLPPCAILSPGGQLAASSTSSWSRNGTRPSRPHAIVMLSTRLTGSSVISSVVSARNTWSMKSSANGAVSSFASRAELTSLTR